MAKAQTKAAKLRARRGRPRLPAGIDTREPNGRLSRRAARRDEQETEIISTVARRRMKHLNLSSIQQATDPRYGYVLGRMLMDGTINEAQHEAGVRYANDMARYYGLTGVPFPSARAMDLFSVRVTGDDESDSKIERAKKAKARMVSLRGVLLAAGDIETGRRVEHTVKLVCVEDVDERRTLPPHMLAWLKRGLNKLAEYYLVSSLTK